MSKNIDHCIIALTIYRAAAKSGKLAEMHYIANGVFARDMEDIAALLKEKAEPQKLTADHPLSVFAREVALGAYPENELREQAKKALEWADAFEMPSVVAWLRNDEMKAMSDAEKQAWTSAGQFEVVAEYNIPLERASVNQVDSSLTPLTDAALLDTEDCVATATRGGGLHIAAVRKIERTLRAAAFKAGFR